MMNSMIQNAGSNSRTTAARHTRVYVLATLACLGSWMFGYNVGVIGGTIVLPSFHSDFHLPDIGTSEYNTISSNIISMFQLGGLLGSMLTFPATTFCGRTIIMAIASAIYLIGSALQTFSAGTLGMMYAGRFVTGITAGSITVLVPLYIAEISPAHIRGSLVGVYEINNQLSSLMGYWCNYIVNQYIPSTESRQWQVPMAMQFIPAALLLVIAIFILPESPRFLVKRGNMPKAIKTLAHIRHLPEDDENIILEIDTIQEAVQRQQLMQRSTTRFGLAKELLWKGNRNRLVIGTCLMLGQNATGINAVNFYTPTIFKSIGFDGTEVILLASGMFAVVKSVTTILSLLIFVDRAGRKKLLMVSAVGGSLSMWYIGAFVTAAHVDLTKHQAKSAAGWVAIVCIYTYAASFSIAWNGVVWIYCSEIFPTRIKDLAFCLTTAVQWLSTFAVARAAPYMLTNMGGGFFFLWASCMVIMCVSVWLFVPETKGRPLEKMDEIFGTPYESAGHVQPEMMLTTEHVDVRDGDKGIHRA